MEKNEIRCTCPTRPKLATYGISSAGKLFIHVKVWKRKQIYGEIIAEGGVVRLRCRVCSRWHRIIIRQPGNRPILRIDHSMNESILRDEP